MIVTVGPLLSHRLWKVLAAQPSTDARQQRFHREDFLWATGLSQVLKYVKYLTSFPTIAEPVNPPTRHETEKKGNSDVESHSILPDIGNSPRPEGAWMRGPKQGDVFKEKEGHFKILFSYVVLKLVNIDTHFFRTTSRKVTWFYFNENYFWISKCFKHVNLILVIIINKFFQTLRLPKYPWHWSNAPFENKIMIWY